MASTSNCPGSAGMHHKKSEDSWRPAGFCVVDKTDYLARYEQARHNCFNQHETDAPWLPIDNTNMPEGLEKDLIDTIVETDMLCSDQAPDDIAALELICRKQGRHQ